MFRKKKDKVTMDDELRALEMLEREDKNKSKLDDE